MESGKSLSYVRKRAISNEENKGIGSNKTCVKLLFQLAEYRLELYYAFGLLCLASWFAFNLWILRDYFFPWWFQPIYTETGLSKQKLQLKKQEILIRNRVSVAFVIPAQIGAPLGSQMASEIAHNSSRSPWSAYGGRSMGARAQSITPGSSVSNLPHEPQGRERQLKRHSLVEGGMLMSGARRSILSSSRTQLYGGGHDRRKEYGIGGNMFIAPLNLGRAATLDMGRGSEGI